MLMPILSTKLYIPEIREERVIRRDLVERMSQGINMNTKFTLVSAPAGYGKTTLVLELIKALKLSSAWISLDEGDNDLTQFLSYFIAALKRAGVDIGADTEKLAFDINLSSTQAPMTMIINDIAAMSEKVIFVFDDFHLIQSPYVSGAIKFLLEHQPPNFHLIIITREDPNLPLSHLRVQGRMTEVRLEDLCFSNEETKDFLQRIMGIELGEEMIKAISQRTEGWAAGLQLVGLSLNSCGEEDAREFIRYFQDTHRYIIDYLVEEVINRQRKEIQGFLCRTSVLERMNGALCDAITGRSDSRQLLRELERANLFLIPLDSKREWYRYHHLFADSLRTELAEEEEYEIHRRAAIWFRDNGFKQEAVKHALKSHDMLLAVKLVEDCTEDAFKRAQLSTLIKWMDSIPSDLVKESNILSVRKAWALLLTGRSIEAIQYLASLGQEFFNMTTRHNKGLILSFKAITAQQGSGDDSEALAKEALEFLEPWDPIARISTMNTLGRVQEGKGRIIDANRIYTRAYNEASKLGCTFITTITLKNLGVSLNTMGKCTEAMDLYINYIEKMKNEFGKELPFVGIIYIGLAELYLDRNELEKARDYIDKGKEQCNSISYGWTLEAEMLNARILYAIGEKEYAIRLAEDALAAARRENNSKFNIRYTPVLTDMLLRAGKAQEAMELEETSKNKTESNHKDPNGFEYIDKLSKREIEILKLIAEGMSNNDIARTLYISTNTTQWHISHIYSKLRVKNRTQAVIKARELEIL